MSVASDTARGFTCICVCIYACIYVRVYACIYLYLCNRGVSFRLRRTRPVALHVSMYVSVGGSMHVSICTSVTEVSGVGCVGHGQATAAAAGDGRGEGALSLV